MNTTQGNEKHSKVTGHFFVHALHDFHRFNKRYHVKKLNYILRLSSLTITLKYLLFFDND